MSILSLVLLLVLLSDQVSTMPFVLLDPPTISPQAPRNAVKAAPLSNMEIRSFQRATDLVSATLTSTPVSTLHRVTTSHTISSDVDAVTSAPAQPTYLPGNVNESTQVQTASMVIAALGVPIAGVMLYLAWATFLRDRHLGSESHNSESSLGEEHIAPPSEGSLGVNNEMAR